MQAFPAIPKIVCFAKKNTSDVIQDYMLVA